VARRRERLKQWRLFEAETGTFGRPDNKKRKFVAENIISAVVLAKEFWGSMLVSVADTESYVLVQNVKVTEPVIA
jgi:hypothetical protein